MSFKTGNRVQMADGSMVGLVVGESNDRTRDGGRILLVMWDGDFEAFEESEVELVHAPLSLAVKPGSETEEQVEAFVQGWLAEAYPDLHGASLTACLESNKTWWVGVSTEFGDGWDSPSMTAYVKPDWLSDDGWSIEGLY